MYQNITWCLVSIDVFSCGFQSQKPSPGKPKDNINTGSSAFRSIYTQTLFCLLHPKSCCHVHDSSHPPGNRGMPFKPSTHPLTLRIVQLCCWLCSHFCANCHIVHLHIFFPPSPVDFVLFFWRMFGTVNGHLELSVVQFYLSLMAGQEMCWWNASIMSLFSVCAPNTIVCWELLGYWP